MWQAQAAGRVSPTQPCSAMAEYQERERSLEPQTVMQVDLTRG